MRPRIVFSAGNSDSGKTLVTAAVLRILRARGYRVQPFKVGPDYLDPMYLGLAAGRPCRTLDSWIMDEETVLSSFVLGCEGSDLAVVEGVRGLYEGASPVGDEGSTAHIAKILRAPVVVVLNAQGLSRSAAALLMGLRAMDDRINLAGVILNKVRDERHEEKLRRAIYHYTDIPVLGSLYRSPLLEMEKRHLGLIPPHELGEASKKIETAAELLEERLDLERLLKIAAEAPPIEHEPEKRTRRDEGISIGVFMDQAFFFYYHENLLALKERGAEIVPVNSLSDRSLREDLSGVLIGGGYPELFSRELEGNRGFRNSLKRRIMEGLPVIGECGGLMYLCRSIEQGGKKRRMVGVFDGEVTMYKEPQALSYVELESVRSNPLAESGRMLRGHEFHYSSVEGLSSEMAFRVLRGKGIRDGMDGALCHRAIGMYTHLHYFASPEVPTRFMEECRAYSRR